MVRFVLGGYPHNGQPRKTNGWPRLARRYRVENKNGPASAHLAEPFPTRRLTLD
jgi:hypothetical protein